MKYEKELIQMFEEENDVKKLQKFNKKAEKLQYRMEKSANI